MYSRNFNYKNNFDLTGGLLNIPMSYYQGYNMGQANDLTNKGSNTLAMLSAGNSALNFGANLAKDNQDRRYRQEEDLENYYDSFINRNNTQYYNPHNYAHGGMKTNRHSRITPDTMKAINRVCNKKFQNGGKAEPIVKHLLPIYNHYQPLKNSNGSDIASLYGKRTFDQVESGYSNYKTKDIYSSHHPKANPNVRHNGSKQYDHMEYGAFNRVPYFEPEKFTKGGTLYNRNGYYANPNADSYMVPTNGNITMNNVPVPMVGTSMDTGESKLMMPQKDYHFKNTKHVFEQPIRSLPKYLR